MNNIVDCRHYHDSCLRMIYGKKKYNKLRKIFQISQILSESLQLGSFDTYHTK